MKQELTKREKLLIFSAALLVLFYLAFQFGFLPLYDRFTEGRAERERYLEDKAAVEANIANRSGITDSNEGAHQQLDTIRQDFPLLVPNEEISTVLTNLCLTNNLSPSALNITRPADPARSPQNDDQETATPLFTVVTVTMNVTGNYSSILGLIDDVDKLPYILITKMNYTENRGAETSETGSIAMTFELTYINP